MRTRVAMAAITLAFMLNGASTEAADWCAWYDAYTYNCGFHTLDQCRATVSGDTAAFCARNIARESTYDRPRHNRDPKVSRSRTMRHAPITFLAPRKCGPFHRRSAPAAFAARVSA